MKYMEFSPCTSGLRMFDIMAHIMMKSSFSTENYFNYITSLRWSCNLIVDKTGCYPFLLLIMNVFNFIKVFNFIRILVKWRGENYRIWLKQDTFQIYNPLEWMKASVLKMIYLTWYTKFGGMSSFSRKAN